MEGEKSLATGGYVSAAAPSTWEKKPPPVRIVDFIIHFCSYLLFLLRQSLMTLTTIFVVVYFSPGHHSGDRRDNFQNPHSKENIWAATAKPGTSSLPCEFCHLSPAVPLHVRRPVLRHHRQPSLPPPSPPTHLIWPFVARAEPAGSTVILIF